MKAVQNEVAKKQRKVVKKVTRPLFKLGAGDSKELLEKNKIFFTFYFFYIEYICVNSDTKFTKKVKFMKAVQNEVAKKQRKVIKKVTRPLFKLGAGDSIVVKILTAIAQAKPLKNDKNTEDKKPPFMMDVVNLDTGEEGQMIVPAVLKSSLEDDEDYANGKYVGRCFEITKGDKKPCKGGGGQTYSEFTIVEVAE